MKKLVYPAVLYPWDDGGGYTVEVPDFPGCVTEGESLAEAIEMGVDAASGWLLSELEEGNKIPVSSDIDKIVPNEDNGIKQYLVLDMDRYSEKYGQKAVRKNLTIPSWLNTLAEKNGVNFSDVLKDALVDKLHI